jgi:hypothetical protein
MKRLLAVLISLVAATGADSAAGQPPGVPPGMGGPWLTSTAQGTLQLVPSPDGLRKEYHGNGPILILYMDDGVLRGSAYFHDVGRKNNDWDLTIKAASDVQCSIDWGQPNCGYVSLSLRSQTYWSTEGSDGSYLHRNGYYLKLLDHDGQTLFERNLDNFGGGGTDNCGHVSNPWFKPFSIPFGVYARVDSVSVQANADRMWWCQSIERP